MNKHVFVLEIDIQIPRHIFIIWCMRRRFSAVLHARTKLLASKIYIGLINIDFFHIVMQIFGEISRDTTFTTVNLPIETVS